MDRFLFALNAFLHAWVSYNNKTNSKGKENPITTPNKKNKTVKFIVNSRPDHPEFGYGDYVQILEKKNIIFGSHASTCPNPFLAIDKNIKWRALYGWIASSVYEYKCIEHHRFGKCLIINNGGEVASRTPNPNHDGKYILTEMFVHIGAFMSQNQEWRGSRGCLTLHPNDYINFISNFDVGDSGILIVEDMLTNHPIN